MPTRRRDVDPDARLEDVFVTEARERVDEGRGILARGFPAPGSPEIRTLYRHAHTLKGIAHALGLDRIEALSKDVAERTRPFELQEREMPSTDREIVREEWSALRDEVEAFARRVRHE